MDLIIAFCARHWKIVLVATVISCLMGLLWLKDIQLDRAEGKITTLQEKVDMLQAEKDAAIAATERTKREYDKALNDAKANAQALVEQAEKNALANFKKRYGGSLCSGFAGGVRLPAAPAAGSGANESPIKPDETSGEQLAAPAEFINACGRDAARLNAFIQLCADANCEVVE